MPTEPTEPASEDKAIDNMIAACESWLRGYENLKQGIAGLREIFKPPEPEPPSMPDVTYLEDHWPK